MAYTGTHDNDTTVGWWHSKGAGDSTRTAEDIRREREFTRRYLDTDGSEIHWAFIRALMASVADTVLFPLQDVLGLGKRSAHEYAGRAQRQLALALSGGDVDPGDRASAERHGVHI